MSYYCYYVIVLYISEAMTWLHPVASKLINILFLPILIPHQYICDKVFKNGPSKICGRQLLKNLKASRPLQTFKGCLPRILLGPFLNTLSNI